MLVRLGRAKRFRAGRLLALIYMLCVLAPNMSFAFSDGTRDAPCLTDEDHVVGFMHVHEAVPVAQHVHEDGREHKHTGAFSADRADLKSAAAETSSPLGGEHKTHRGQCCGMVCVSALPATFVEFVQPFAPTSRCVSEIYRSVADNAPPTHYRPPIS